MKFVKVNKTAMLLLLGIFLLFFLLRLPHLTLQPIFADEAIYVRWAQVMRAEPTLRFLSLTDGKTPLFMWTLIPLFKVFKDPLLAGRFLSVLSGFATLSGAFFLGWRFFNLRSGLWAALLVATIPFMVFFDRMALVDSMLAAFSLWSLILSLLVVRYLRLDLAMFLGYSLGGGLLTKTPAMFNLLVLPISILAANLQSRGREKRILKVFGLWLIAIVIALGMYNALRLGPEFDKLSTRNEDYIFSPIELVGRPLDPFIPHARDLWEFIGKLWGVVIIFAVFFAAVWVMVKKNVPGLVVLLWALIPLLVEMALLKTFTARYILSSIPPLLVLGGWGFAEMERLFNHGRVVPKLLIVPLLAVALLAYPLYFDYTLLTKPAEASIPINDHKGYFEEWTAGYGLRDVAKFLDEKSKLGPIVVGTEGSFGTLPEGLQIYFDKDRQVAFVPGKATVSAQLRQAALEHPTFFVANKSRFLGAENLKLLQEYPKAMRLDGTRDATLLFQVFPEANKND